MPVDALPRSASDRKARDAYFFRRRLNGQPPPNACRAQVRAKLLQRRFNRERQGAQKIAPLVHQTTVLVICDLKFDKVSYKQRHPFCNNKL